MSNFPNDVTTQQQWEDNRNTHLIRNPSTVKQLLLNLRYLAGNGGKAKGMRGGLTLTAYTALPSLYQKDFPYRYVLDKQLTTLLNPGETPTAGDLKLYQGLIAKLEAGYELYYAIPAAPVARPSVPAAAAASSSSSASSTVSIPGALATLRAQLAERDRTIASHQRESQALQSELKTKEDEVNQMELKLKEAEQGLKDAKKKLDLRTTTIAELRSSSDSTSVELRNTIAELRTQLNTANEEKEQREKTMAEYMKNKTEAMNKLGSDLKEQTEKKERTDHEVERLKNALDRSLTELDTVMTNLAAFAYPGPNGEQERKAIVDTTLALTKPVTGEARFKILSDGVKKAIAAADARMAAFSSLPSSDSSSSSSSSSSTDIPSRGFFAWVKASSSSSSSAVKVEPKIETGIDPAVVVAAALIDLQKLITDTETTFGVHSAPVPDRDPLTVPTAISRLTDVIAQARDKNQEMKANIERLEKSLASYPTSPPVSSSSVYPIIGDNTFQSLLNTLTKDFFPGLEPINLEEDQTRDFATLNVFITGIIKLTTGLKVAVLGTDPTVLANNKSTAEFIENLTGAFTRSTLLTNRVRYAWEAFYVARRDGAPRLEDPEGVLVDAIKSILDVYHIDEHSSTLSTLNTAMTTRDPVKVAKAVRDFVKENQDMTDDVVQRTLDAFRQSLKDVSDVLYVSEEDREASRASIQNSDGQLFDDQITTLEGISKTTSASLVALVAKAYVSSPVSSVSVPVSSSDLEVRVKAALATVRTNLKNTANAIYKKEDLNKKEIAKINDVPTNASLDDQITRLTNISIGWTVATYNGWSNSSAKRDAETKASIEDLQARLRAAQTSVASSSASSPDVSTLTTQSQEDLTTLVKATNELKDTVFGKDSLESKRYTTPAFFLTELIRQINADNPPTGFWGSLIGVYKRRNATKASVASSAEAEMKVKMAEYAVKLKAAEDAKGVIESQMLAGTTTKQAELDSLKKEVLRLTNQVRASGGGGGPPPSGSSSAVVVGEKEKRQKLAAFLLGIADGAKA